MTQPRAPTAATEHMPLSHPCSPPCLGREGKLAPAADLWSHPRIDSDRSSVLHPPDRPDALITVCRAQCSPAAYKTAPRCPRVPINPTATGGTPEHHTKNGRRVEETRRKEGEEWRRRSGTGPRRSQECRPDQLQRRSCSAQHCIASSRPRLATAPPSYRHKPYGEPRRSPLVALAVLAMNATAFPHLGEAEAEHSRSWTRCTRTAHAQAQGLASPTPSGSGTLARPLLASRMP